ncbi:MAG: amidohydrolase, partial [Longimicrobiales bacterium]
MRTLPLILTFATLAPARIVSAPAPALAQEADLILTGATIWTAEPGAPRARAVAIAADRIIAVGDSVDVARHAGPGTRTLRLDGRFIAPGF